MSTGQGPQGPNHGGNTPIPPQDHDVLVFPQASVTAATGAECYQFPVTKTGVATSALPAGAYSVAPQPRTLEDPGLRKALSFMHPERSDPKEARGKDWKRGPAFAVSPVKAEPAPASFFTCFMINAEYFTEPNLWTLEEWADAPGGADYGSRPHPPSVEALIAVPWGEVLKLTIWRPKELAEGSISEEPAAGAQNRAIAEKRPARSIPKVDVARVDLESEPELWQQLRNGCIAGRAKLGTGETAKVLPLVNITALTPLPERKD